MIPHSKTSLSVSDPRSEFDPGQEKSFCPCPGGVFSKAMARQLEVCGKCHMSATRNQPLTHDVGARISWTLRPVVSKKLETWETRRESMQDVGATCHAPDFVGAFYTSFDRAVEMWNRKFALPAQRVMDTLRSRGKITPTPFDEEVEWSFYRLWHHEMAERFYFDFLPKPPGSRRRRPRGRPRHPGDPGFPRASLEEGDVACGPGQD